MLVRTIWSHNTTDTINKFCVEVLKNSGPKKWNWKKADWPRFISYVEEHTEHITEDADMDRANKAFVKAVMEAARRYIPKRGNKKGLPWWSNDIGVAIKKRNELTKIVLKKKNPSDEEVEALRVLQRDVQERINKAKLSEWNRHMEKISRDPNKAEAYVLLKKIDGRSLKPGVSALRVGDNWYTTDRTRANALGESFAKKCTPVVVPHSHKILGMIQEQSKKVPAQKVAVTMAELKHAITTQKKGKTPGPDGVCAEMLERLGQNALGALLHIYNLSWSAGRVPTEWKRTYIKPLLKKHKDSSQTESYRPISLTSIVAKTMERIIKDRITHLQNTGKVTAPKAQQSGFKEGRSTTENILYVADRLQAIKDNGRMGGVVLFDLKGAFDTVWHTMLTALLDAYSYPEDYVKWISNFLKGRSIAVDVNGVRGRESDLHGGVPQGTILAPQLFTEYLNFLSFLLDTAGFEHCIYADDIAVVLNEATKGELQKKAQTLLTLMEKWGKACTMQLSTEKTEFLLAGNTPDDLDVRYENKEKLRLVREATYLGVTLDSQLTFDAHVESIIHRTSYRMRVMKKLAGTSWGMRRDTLRTLYLTYVLPVMRYALGAWGPLLRQEHVKRLAGKHLEAGRMITGLARNTSGRVVLTEAGLQDFEDVLKADSLLLYEACRRKRDTIGSKVTDGALLGTNWGGMQNKEARKIGLPREKEVTPVGPCIENRLLQIAPWEEVAIDVRPTLKEAISKVDKPEVKRAAALRTLRELPRTQFIVYTDGSVKDGQNGGAGVLVMDRVGNTDTFKIKKVKRSAGVFCTSYRAELVAMIEGLKELIKERAELRGDLLVCTDSQALLRRLQQGPRAAGTLLEKELWCNIQVFSKAGRTIIMQFVPSHCGIQGNEIADKLAKGASEEHRVKGTHAKDVDYKTVRTYVLQRVYGDTHREWMLDVKKDVGYKELTDGKHHRVDSLPNRAAEVHIMRLRARQSELLRTYLQQNPGGKDIACAYCNRVQTLEHIFVECTSTWRSRRKHLAGYTLKQMLTTEAKRAYEFLRELEYVEGKQEPYAKTHVETWQDMEDMEDATGDQGPPDDNEDLLADLEGTDESHTDRSDDTDDTD
eukprot:TRINITY_DN736_c0_g1_i2.p1 TRINITY_DN736_c0_g1~~TRINITY_DN736_c0_g1_i2.p1  ORF type:complete len:1104 (+),score=252.26 TRINITY_DN736_c0_g1_i2:278-3589(+)